MDTNFVKNEKEQGNGVNNEHEDVQQNVPQNMGDVCSSDNQSAQAVMPQSNGSETNQNSVLSAQTTVMSQTTISQREEDLTKAENAYKVKVEQLHKQVEDLKQREQNLAVKTKKLIEAEDDYKAKVAEFNKQVATLKKQQQDLAAKEVQAENTNEDLANKAMALELREQNLESSQNALRADRQDFEKRKQQELLDLQKKLNENWENSLKLQEEKLEQIRLERLNLLNAEEDKARKTYLERLENTLAVRKQEFETVLEQRRSQCESDLQTRENKLRELQNQLEEKEYETKNLASQNAAISESLKRQKDSIASQVEEKTRDEIRLWENKLNTKEIAFADLLADNALLHESLRHFETLAQKLGGTEPEQILHEMRDRELRIKQLREELAERPPKELQARYAELEAQKQAYEKEKEEQRAKISEMTEICIRQAQTEADLNTATNENTRLQQERDMLETHNNKLMEELKRLKVQYGAEAERDERIQVIEEPLLGDKQVMNATSSMEVMDKILEQNENLKVLRDTMLSSNDSNEDTIKSVSEILWLENIANSCAQYDLIFPRRILYAFHTSLKVAEMSPITVLAGVSGTGKSELPKLYSLFGGLNFMMVPVQPNWDSQESMLGFFNTIDNKFDAQPVLHFLAQSQKVADENYPRGMRKAINLVLLDEMNLAHMELYFAEFLSKLEARRGKKYQDCPCLEVKLGSGMKPHNITLGRNVLWAGTMNQDETTKSLSDKVIDRSSVIYFPRPAELKSRKKMLKPLIGASELLPSIVWHKDWQVWDINLTNKDVEQYKSFVEDINKALSTVGRALGHRVWQSIEYYMANYPATRLALTHGENGRDELARALHIAFEDQLVQKVMPKLRGIETHGKARTDCLDVISNLLASNNYAIVEDFRQACEMGYGQFMWNSASYLDHNGDDVALSLDEIHG